MSWEIAGLPLHPLFVHLRAVAVPVAAILALVAVFWPGARRRMGLVVPAVSLVALISTPLSSSSGEWLEETVPETALVERHAELADLLLPCVIALFVFSAAYWAWNTFGRRVVASKGASRGVVSTASVALPSLLVLASLVSLVVVVLVGHAGSVAVWNG